ncbi:MAG: transporter [Lachnospiraceae bacterium]|nr:transporter [Lachnospiraceae bacterium]
MGERIKCIILLHIALLIYSFSGVFTKSAALEKFMSFKFISFYCVAILMLGIYAICWQQVIKRMPLTTAFANKAVCVVWGMLYGVILFSEHITIGKVIGASLVMIGIVIYSLADKEGEKDEQ